MFVLLTDITMSSSETCRSTLNLLIYQVIYEQLFVLAFLVNNSHGYLNELMLITVFLRIYIYRYSGGNCNVFGQFSLRYD